MSSPKKQQHHTNPKTADKCSEANKSYQSAKDGIREITAQFTDLRHHLQIISGEMGA
jgi:hypothetical protein